MCQTNRFAASCTRKCTRVPTPVPCCSAVPYRTYTPLPPPTPPGSPPGACVVAYAACERKIQNQDFSFDPPRTPLSYTPLSFAAGGREGSNPKCNVCQKYSPGEHAVWQTVGESVKEGSSACPDGLWKLYTRAQRVRARVMNGAVPAGEQAKVGLAPEQSIAQVEEEGEEKEARGGPLRGHVRV